MEYAEPQHQFLLYALCKSLRSYFFRWTIFDVLYNNLYWRNTKDSIGDQEFQIPNYKTKLCLIDFHKVEKALYDDMESTGSFSSFESNPQDDKLAVCQNPFCDNNDCSTLEQLRMNVIETHEVFRFCCQYSLPQYRLRSDERWLVNVQSYIETTKDTLKAVVSPARILYLKR